MNWRATLYTIGMIISFAAILLFSAIAIYRKDAYIAGWVLVAIIPLNLCFIGFAIEVSKKHEREN